MITKLNVATIYVLDKDEALDFYVNKLGLEKGQDVKQGSYRWLTVRVPGDVTEISLEQPGSPLHDEATAAQLRELISKGALGGLVVGILPGFDKRDANAYVDIALTTGIGWMRNTLTVRAADAVIMISGGIGTLNELTVAYEDKPTVILEGTGGWSDRIREIAYDGKHLDEAHRATLHFATTPKDAVELALKLARSATGGDGRKEFQS